MLSICSLDSKKPECYCLDAFKFGEASRVQAWVCLKHWSNKCMQIQSNVKHHETMLILSNLPPTSLYRPRLGLHWSTTKTKQITFLHPGNIDRRLTCFNKKVLFSLFFFFFQGTAQPWMRLYNVRIALALELLCLSIPFSLTAMLIPCARHLTGQEWSTNKVERRKQMEVGSGGEISPV